MEERRSAIFVEAAGLRDKHGLHGMARADSPGGGEPAGIYELRRYRLELGYDAVPLFLERLGGGLPSKLSTLAPGSALCSVMHSDVGDLNEVIELWRHAGPRRDAGVAGGRARGRAVARRDREHRAAR